jgi:ADP-ribose pyrophosphatase YjhB (NUDIX family)
MIGEAETVLVHAREPAPSWWDAAVFLAGPTPRSPDVVSWRPRAVSLLRGAWSGTAAPGARLVVFVPEDPGGGVRGCWEEQVVWEDRNLCRADAIAFWVPRDLVTLPGLTTNVEFGRWYSSGKAVLGAPPGAPGIRYLGWYAPGAVTETLPDTMAAALRHLGVPARRSGAERDVPLHLWRRPDFQAWYGALCAAGNELRAARPQWSTRPVFVWTLAVEVWIRAEDRVKSNEVLVIRPETVAVVLYRSAATLLDSEVVLVREYRSSARTVDGYLRELPGGSGPGTPLEQAVAEVREETGLDLAPDRLYAHGSRQVVGTLATHHGHLFSAELTTSEMDRLRAAAGTAYGLAEASERTFVEVTTYGRLLAGNAVDWATLGQVAQVLGITTGPERS